SDHRADRTLEAREAAAASMAERDAVEGTQARPFVGRTHEIAEIGTAIAEAAGGRGGFFLITGEAGSGEARLAGEAPPAAAAGRVRVLWGRAWEGGGAPAYWPWVQVLRETLRGEEPPAGAAAALDVFERPPATGPLDPERARFERFVQVADVLREL